MEMNGWSQTNFLIDGFPRNKDNLDGWERAMDDLTELKALLFLECPENEMIERI